MQSLKPLERTISGNKGADYVTPKVSKKLTNKLSSFMKHERTRHIMLDAVAFVIFAMVRVAFKDAAVETLWPPA
eukprot:15128-Heterococcus_DN1.PRE.2